MGITFLGFFFKVILRDDWIKRRSINPKLSNGTEKNTCNSVGSYGDFFEFRKMFGKKKKDVGLDRWRMNGFCRGKKKDVGLSIWKNEWVLQG